MVQSLENSRVKWDFLETEKETQFRAYLHLPILFIICPHSPCIKL